MKHLRKVLALLLVAALCLCCFAACGEKKPTEPTEPADEAGTLKIGVIGPMTGGAALYGNAVKYGAQLAAKEINAAGGINGMQVEVNVQDDTHDAEKSVNAYNTLKDWGMQILVGTVTSTPCIAVQALCEQDNMFLLTPSATAVESIASPTAFRICFSDPNQGIASADYIASKGLATKIGVIYNSQDAYSSGIYAKFADEAAAKGLEIVAAEAFTEDAKQDFSVQLQKIKSAGAELVFLPIYATEAALILSQAASAGLDAKFFGCDGLDGVLNVENFDTTLAEGVMLLTPFAKDASDEATQNFVKAYLAEYNNDETYLIQFAADAYDCLYAVKAAAEKADIKADMSASEICDLLVPVMAEISIDGVTGAGITWSADGEPNKEPKGVIIEDGAYKAMD
ncbi:MAG: ABC transporter substrate-binding protein [Clostridia bacterium]|nr:ABC transporter substrate-binding protein [Clostridia bacterium]MBR3095153.1 ABC transporter substrate-binding protein [Clostridia bacterium]